MVKIYKYQSSMAYNTKMLYKKKYSFTNQNPLISIKKKDQKSKGEKHCPPMVNGYYK